MAYNYNNLVIVQPSRVNIGFLYNFVFDQNLYSRYKYLIQTIAFIKTQKDVCSTILTFTTN